MFIMNTLIGNFQFYPLGNMLQTMQNSFLNLAGFFLWGGGRGGQWISLPNHILHKLVLEWIYIFGAQVGGVMEGVK